MTCAPRHTPIDVPMNFVGHQQPVNVPTWILKQPVGGAYVLWCITTIYNMVLSKEHQVMTPARWVNTWRPWWKKSLMRLSINPLFHIRRSAETSHADVMDAEDRASEIDYRFLQVPSMSTYCLLHIMVKLSMPSNAKNKSCAAVASWLICLRSWLDKVFRGKLSEFPVCLDKKVEASPGLPCVGDRSKVVMLRVRDGRINLSPIALSDDASVKQVVDLVKGNPQLHNLHISDALIFVLKMGRVGQWLYQQLIMCLAMQIESVLTTEAEDVRVEAAQPVEQPHAEVPGDPDAPVAQPLLASISVAYFSFSNHRQYIYI